MITDPRAVLRAQTPSQAQIQDARRRTNQQPAIQDAQAQADLARKMQPVGSSTTWWGLTDPDEFWMITDGRELDPVAYPDLYEILGTRFNTGGETAGFFRLPNPTGRTLVVAGSVPGDGLTDRDVGATFGAEEHTLGPLQMPTHNHGGSTGSDGAHTHGFTTDPNGSHNHNVGYGGANNTGTSGGGDRLSNVGGSFANGNTDNAGNHPHTGTTNSNGNHNHPVTINDAGGGQAHNNMQPSMAAYEIIRVLP